MQAKFFKESHSLSADNRLIVRVWLPKVNGESSNAYKAVAQIAIKKNRNANIGHASIETKNCYASLWPHPDTPVTELFTVVKPSYQTLQQDEDAENGKSDIVVCLYSLNIKAIEDAYSDVKQSATGYALTGDSSVTDGDGQSCCSLALSLLKRGGLGEPTILPVEESSIMKVMVEPKEFADFICKAKKAELEKYPETKEFALIESEYQPSIKGGFCAVI